VIHSSRVAWWMLAPALGILLLVAAWPLLRTIWFSFTDASLIDLSDSRFIGVENYLYYSAGEWGGILVDPQWWQSVRNTLTFVIISVSLETCLGLLVAVLLCTGFPGRPLLRVAILIPWAIPTVVSAQIWAWLLHDQFGLLNHLLLNLGLLDAPLAWTADPDLVMASVIIADVWKTTPFMALLILAAMQLLPRDCYAAARVDGVSAARVFLHVTLPLIRPGLAVAVIFRSLDALRVFDLIYVLTPNNQQTMSMSVFARQQLVDYQDIGYGSAASVLLFFAVTLFTLILIRLVGLRLREEPH
jgi:trehalose/maltose transport system permease protein